MTSINLRKKKLLMKYNFLLSESLISMVSISINIYTTHCANSSLICSLLLYNLYTQLKIYKIQTFLSIKVGGGLSLFIARDRVIFHLEEQYLKVCDILNIRTEVWLQGSALVASPELPPLSLAPSQVFDWNGAKYCGSEHRRE